MKKHGFIIFLFFFILSCNNKKESENTRELHIIGEHAFKSVKLNFPSRIISIGDYLVIQNDSRVNPFFETLDIRTENIVNSFGKKGKGPGEFIFPASVFYSNSQKKLFVHASVLGQIFYVNDEDLFSPEPSLNKYCDLPREKFFPHSISILDSCFVMQGVSKESERWQFHPIGSNNYYIKGYYREDLIRGNIDGISSYKKIMSLYGKGKILANEQNGRIATIFHFSDLFEIYDVAKDTVISSSDFDYPILMDFSGNGPKDLAKVNKQSVFGYIDFCMVNDLIYCLYSDKTLSELLKQGNTAAVKSNEIHVFDWDTELVCKLRLNIPIHCLTYNEKYNIIIGVRDSPEPEIFYFNNPKI